MSNLPGTDLPERGKQPWDTPFRAAWNTLRGYVKSHDDIITTGRLSVAAVASAVSDAIASASTVVAAAAAAVSAEIAKRNVLEASEIFEPDFAFAVVDEDGRRTWIESDLSGAPTAWSVTKIAPLVAPAVTPYVGLVDQNETASGLIYAVVDEDDRRTWIEVLPDGRPSPRALQILGESLSISTTIPEKSGPNVSLVGHSMLAGAASSITNRLPAVTVTNLAIGGETSRTIVARAGGQPMQVVPAGGQIPASGSVDLTLHWADGPLPTASASPGWPLLQGPASYTGYLVLPDGTKVAGVFAVVRSPSAAQYVHHVDDRYTFTRATSGAAITVLGGLPLYYDVAVPRRSDVMVYWPGRNNTSEPNQIVADVRAQILYQRALDKRFVILSEHNSGAVGSSDYTAITALNEQYRQNFGRRFIDTRKYLIASGLAHAGITATTQDLTDIANDIVPTSLRSDSLHLNAAGSGVVADLIKARLIELGWY